MLAREELENIAGLKKLSLINAEKDYLQDLILFSIYSGLGKELVFKGGTSLYKIYKLNRFSEDLDFTLTKKFKIKKTSDKIISDLALLNIKGRIKEIKEHKDGINIRLLLNGPLYKGGKETQSFIPLNLSLREEVLLEPNKASIIPMYKELPNFELFVMQEKEILAEKVRAVFTRMKPRDIYDLWFLLVRKNVYFDLELISKKLSLYSAKFDFKEFRNRIEKMKGLWRLDLKNFIIGELPEFNKARSEIMSKINL